MPGPKKRTFKNSDFMMLSRRGYFKQLADDLAKTKKGDRVVVATMNLWPDTEEVVAVVAALNAAARRGVTVSLLMDAFDFLVNGVTKIPGPLWHNTKFSLDRPMREPYRGRQAALQELTKNGVIHTVTNLPDRRFTFPFSGRSHIKAVVINDIVYTGGCNLNSPNEIDIMLRWRDHTTADWLYKLLKQVGKVGSVHASMHDKDRVWQVDNKTKLIVDAGIAKQSAIFDEALAMIDNAKEWIAFTSQYFAPGVGTQALARAYKRGVKITYYYSHYSMHGPIEGALHRVAQWRERRRLPLELFERRLPKGQHLHAKVLATENGVMIGSHNYGELGVNVGTAEIALKRDDEAFGKNAVTFIEKQLGL